MNKYNAVPGYHTLPRGYIAIYMGGQAMNTLKQSSLLGNDSSAIIWGWLDSTISIEVTLFICQPMVLLILLPL